MQLLLNAPILPRGQALSPSSQPVCKRQIVHKEPFQLHYSFVEKMAHQHKLKLRIKKQKQKNNNNKKTSCEYQTLINRATMTYQFIADGKCLSEQKV